MPLLLLALLLLSPQSEISNFNRALDDATRRMDNAALLALWADDGISLLPSTKPIAGKVAIAKFLDEVTAQLKGARMTSFTMECHDLTVDAAATWATEWCSEHQVVQLANGKPPFEGWGTMLLVLRRGANGKWLLAREMWQPAAH